MSSDDDDGDGPKFDAPPINLVDSAQTPDSTTNPTFDAAPTVSSADLGKPCNSSTPCTAPAECTTLTSGATTGFCTVPCTKDPDSCAAGYPAGTNGVPGCYLTDNQTGASYCAVLCGTGTTVTSNGPCPYSLTCKLDGDNNTTNGNEFCAN